MEQHEENKQVLIDNFYRASLFGADKVRVDNFDYYVKNEKIIISRIYHNSKAEKIVVPDEFDIFHATLIRKRLKYLDLGRCKDANVAFRTVENLEVFIAKELDLMERDWINLLRGGYNLKFISIDKLKYIYEKFMAESKYSLIEGSFKSMVIIYERGFKDYTMMEKITLSKCLKEVHQDAFKYCISLKEVDFYGTKEDLERVEIKEGNECFKKAKFNFIEERN